MPKLPKIKEELHKLLKPVVAQHEMERKTTKRKRSKTPVEAPPPPAPAPIIEPKFFLHAGDGSTGFADLEAAKAYGRKFPSAAYISTDNGIIIWERTKTGKETIL